MGASAFAAATGGLNPSMTSQVRLLNVARVCTTVSTTTPLLPPTITGVFTAQRLIDIQLGCALPLPTVACDRQWDESGNHGVPVRVRVPPLVLSNDLQF